MVMESLSACLLAGLLPCRERILNMKVGKACPTMQKTEVVGLSFLVVIQRN
jgi:hypothetical protein